MKSSRIMDAFCKDAARGEWTPAAAKPQKLKKKHRFSLTKRNTFGQPIIDPTADSDVIPVAHPRRLSRAPRLEEDYRWAQGEGPLSTSKGGAGHSAPAVVYPLDQFAVNESTAASYQRRSWALKSRGGAAPSRQPLVTIAEFEEGGERPTSAYVSGAASYPPERQNESRPARSPPLPPKDEPSPKAPSSQKPTQPTAAPAPSFSPHPGPNQYIQQSSRRPPSQRIFRANSRGTGPKRASSKKHHHQSKEKIISIGTGRPKIVEIVPAARRRSHGVQKVVASPVVVETAAVAHELPATSSPKEARAVELPAAAPALIVTAPTPIPQPTRRPPPPPTAAAEKTVYKPYRAPTPEAAVEKPLPIIPPLVTGWPDWGKEKKQEVIEEKKMKQEVQKKDGEKVPEVKKAIAIPDALRIGMGSSSLEARLGSLEALAVGGRY